MPQAVATLAAQYDAVNATLDATTARTVLERTQPLQAVIRSFAGFEFLRSMVEDATSVDFDDTQLAVDIQGSIHAHTPCPGWQDGTPLDAATQGFIDVTIGVESSRVQRSFGGHTTQCRFIADQPGARSNILATMDLEIDLGGSLGFGEPPPAILVRASNVTGLIDNTAMNLADQVISFRLGNDSSIETFVDLTTLGAGLSGSALLAALVDGRWAVRVRDGQWICSAGGSEPCVFQAGA
jgi:hypothetical protein